MLKVFCKLCFVGLFIFTLSSYAFASSGNIVLTAIKLHPDDPFKLDFVFSGRNINNEKALQHEAEKQIGYFLSALAIPCSDLWVNLSPKEQAIPPVLGDSRMGVAMLNDDYLLKQLASGLTNPNLDCGNAFWKEAENTALLRKVWITPEKAEVYLNGDTVTISQSSMTVKLEQGNNAALAFARNILPVLKEKVNFGDEFQRVRQIYNAVILATWFKGYVKGSAFNDAIRNSNLVDISKNTGAVVTQVVYDRYLNNVKKGTYNIIKNKRKYYSGGINVDVRPVLRVARHVDPVISTLPTIDVDKYTVKIDELEAAENEVEWELAGLLVEKDSINPASAEYAVHSKAIREKEGEMNSLLRTIRIMKDTKKHYIDEKKESLAAVDDWTQELSSKISASATAGKGRATPPPLPKNLSKAVLPDMPKLEEVLLEVDDWTQEILSKASPKEVVITNIGGQKPTPVASLPSFNISPKVVTQCTFTAEMQAYQGAFTSACLAQCGIDAFAQGDYRKAEQFLLLAVKADTNNERAYYNLAIVRLSVYNFAQAVRDLDQAITRGADIKAIPNWNELLDYALTCTAHNDPNFILRNKSEWANVADDSLKKKVIGIAQASVASGILQRNPMDLGAKQGLQRYFIGKNGLPVEAGDFPARDFSQFDHNVKGHHLAKAKQYKEAAASFLEALKVDKDNAQILSSIGECYAEMGDYPKAVIYLQQVQKITPSDIKLLNYIGFVKEEQGDYKGALLEYDKVLAIDPKNILCLKNSAAAYSHLGQHGMAARRLAQADDIDKGKEYEDKGSGLPTVPELMKQAVDKPIGMFQTVKDWSPHIARIDTANILKKAMLGMDYNHRWMVLNLLDEWGEYVNSSTITDITLGMMELTPQYVIDGSDVLGKYLSEGVVNELMMEAANSMGIDWIKSKCDIHPAKLGANDEWAHSEDGTYLYNVENPSIQADLQGNVFGGGLPAFTQKGKGKKVGGIEYKASVGAKGKLNVVYDSKTISKTEVKGFRAYISLTKEQI